METKKIKAYGNIAPDASLDIMTIERRALLTKDVEIETLYCGICHSDLVAIKNEHGMSQYPVVPGHEIVGRITAVGEDVTRFKIGDIVAVGCITDSCRHCHYCDHGDEQFCEEGFQVVFDSDDKILGGRTYGGFSESLVVDENYVLSVPEGADLAATAPLLCAGITVYSPLKHWNTGPGKKVGVIGIGGLGHLALKIAKAMGAKVIAFTTSPSKVDDALALGADEVVVSTDEQQMSNQNGFDILIDTVSGQHDVNHLLHILKPDGTLVMVGLPIQPLEVYTINVVHGRKSLAGSNIGGIKETQEMLDFCAKHQITADIELINIQQINEALERLEKNKVKYRFVIDMASLNKKGH